MYHVMEAKEDINMRIVFGEVCNEGRQCQCLLDAGALLRTDGAADLVYELHLPLPQDYIPGEFEHQESV